MAASMRDSPLDGGHRGKVADPNNKTTHSAAAAPASTTAAGAVVSASNFEYDDNEWDIGIGNLIIDLDADIEKTNEKGGVGAAGTVGVGVVPPQQPQQQAANNNTINNNNNFHSNSMASTGTGASAKGKMSAAAAVEHSATVDKGLKMKIKRTKPGTKEAKHEIVKAPVQDGATGATAVNNASSIVAQNGDSVECAKVGAGSKHPGGTGGSKRGSSGHRRDKARDKHADKQQQQQQQPALAKTADVNGVLPATPVVSGAGSVTGPPTAAVAPTSAQQQLPATPTVAAAPGPTPPLPVSSQPQVTPPSPASQVQSVPLQPTVPSSTVVQQQQASPVTPAAPPQSVLQQPPAAAADLPPQATTLLVFPGAGPTAPGVCVSVTGGNTNKSLALQQQPPSEPPSAKPSAVKQQAGLEDTGPTSAGSSSCTSTSPPPSKKLKTGPLVNCVGSAAASATVAPCALTTNGLSCGDPKQSDVTDVCVGTSVGTITEPDCLGPCEPGTSVTLEGIVWHETEGGVLVVNVTWRGKTYVGTLLDCTKHDWAPPRFCDSPTSDLDARTPKGRGKRGRAAAATPANDLSNFTETRSSVHSKLRNGAKGRRGAAGSPAPPTVPPFVTPKPDNNSKRKGRASETEEPPAPTGVGNGGGGKRSRSGSRGPTISPPVSPVLLECPEPNCSKKYKHINGLKYHQSHAHGGGEEDSLLDSKDAISLSENDESNAEPPSVPPSPSPEKCSPLPKSEVRKEEAPVLEQLPAVPPQSSSPSQTPLALPSSVPPAEVVSADKNLVKPGVLRFGPTEDSPSMPPASHFPVGVYCNSNSKTAVSSPSSLTNIRAVTLTAPTTSPVINIPQPPSVKLLPSSQSAVQQPSPLPPAQQQSLSQIPQSPQPIPTSVTPPSTAQPQDMAGNKLCDKYKVKIPPAPQRPAPVQGLAVSPLKAVQPSKTVPLIPELGDKKDKSKVGVVLQGSPQQQQPQQPPQTQPQQLTIPLQQQQQQQLVNKKKNRKSPASSPQPDSLHNGAMMYGMESSPLALPTPNEGREDVQSPAYSDISDDGAPVLESEVGDKGQTKLDKKVESQPQHNLGHYGIYPFYGQPPYLVPSVPSSTVVPSDKGKDAEKGDSSKPLDRSMDKEKKEMPGSVTSPADFQQKLLQQQQAPPPQPQQAHYFPYGYVPGYPYNLDSYPMSVMTEKYMQEPQEPLERPKSLSEKDKIKDIKEEKMSASNMDTQSAKNASMSMKDRPIKSEPSNLKEKQNENHQILKESIEMKSQMNDKSKFSSYDANQYLYRQQQEDLRRYYLYPEQQAQAAQAVAARRKEPSAQPLDATVSKDKGGSKSSSTLGSPKVSSHKDKSEDKQSEKKEQDKASKQEGVKPTMETQGPPPPTSSYAYIHPGYMQSPHYPFDPNVYRAMSPMIVNPYGGNPYLHPQMRYHGPEDLSRGPPAAPPKALDMLQHHASQYYSSHKIHELQERALKSPTPKSTSTPQPAPPSTASGPPSSGAVGSSAGSTGPSGPPAAPGPPTGKPPLSADGKDAPAPLRSPPPQRHVHTHHHTHVGLGYPLLPPGQYPAPYGGKPLVRP